MRRLIKLKIEQFIESQEEYFVATSEDLEGLVAEGKTIEEVVEIAQDVAINLLKLEEEIHANAKVSDFPAVFEYPLILEM